MSVQVGSYKEPDRGYRFDFRYRGQRFRSPRGFRTKALCDAAERALRERLIRHEYGIPDVSGPAPSFSRWAGTVYDYAKQREQLGDLQSLDRNIRKVLQFWGTKPNDPEKVVRGAPYHNLTLDAPIRDGGWLLKFEEWMDGLELAGSTKNHYRSACSKFYRVALRPEYRAQTGITVNPFVGGWRDRPKRRETFFTKGQLRQVMAHASPMLKLAIRLAILAPSLRLGTIADLRWSQVDYDLEWIIVHRHKTSRKTGAHVTPIVPELRTYLKRARNDQPKRATHVVTEYGAYVSVRMIQKALRHALEAAGLTYGTGEGELSFHALRHLAGTTLAELGASNSQRKGALGHQSLAASEIYTHLRPASSVEPLERLAEELGDALRD